MVFTGYHGNREQRHLDQIRYARKNSRKMTPKCRNTAKNCHYVTVISSISSFFQVDLLHFVGWGIRWWGEVSLKNTSLRREWSVKNCIERVTATYLHDHAWNKQRVGACDPAQGAQPGALWWPGVLCDDLGWCWGGGGAPKVEDICHSSFTPP